MSESENIKLVVRALEMVPPKNLKLVDLINQYIGKDGRLDYKTLSNITPEVNLAEAEASSYVRATESAIRTLMVLKPVTGEAI